MTLPPAPRPDGAAPPKYVFLSNQLADRIEAGEWANGRIPTVRELAAEYAVSSFTASRALHLLQQRGMVVTRERSGCYVASAMVAAAERWAVVLRTTPGAGREAVDAATRAGFDAVGAADRLAFAHVPFGFEPDADPAELVQRVVASGARGVCVRPSRGSDEAARQDEAFLAGCRVQGIPVVLLDRNLRGADRPLGHDLVGADHHAGGRACTRHLLDLGRRRIACVVGSPCSSHLERASGYLAALTEGGHPATVVRLPDGLEPAESLGWLAERLAASGADGVVCPQDDVAADLIAELTRRGLRVPRDVAVVGCGDLSVEAEITTYRTPAADVVRWAVRLLRQRQTSPTDPPVRVAVPGQLVVRESTAG